MCEKNPKQAQNAIKNFSEYLHGNLEFLSKKEFVKVKDEKSFSDFSSLENRLNEWIIEQLKEKRKHD